MEALIKELESEIDASRDTLSLIPEWCLNGRKSLRSRIYGLSKALEIVKKHLGKSDREKALRKADNPQPDHDETQELRDTITKLENEVDRLTFALAKAEEKPQVWVLVDGGNIQGIHGSPGMSVHVLDRDIPEDDRPYTDEQWESEINTLIESKTIKHLW